MKKSWIGKLATVALAATMFVGCSSNGNAGNAANSTGQPEASKPKGKLTVYIGFQEDHAVKAIDQFTKDTGIQAEMIRMSAGEILAKIRAEKDNPQASVWYGGPADTFVQAVTEDLLEPYVSPVADKIEAKYKDPDGYWTGVYVGAVAFASNKEFLAKKGLEAPTKWSDLTDPKLKGEIVMASPASSGTAYTAIYSILKAFGDEERGFDYLKQLHPQVQQYTTSGAAPGRMVGMGEAGVGILFAHDIIKYQEEGFDNLVMSFPEDGTGYETGSIGIIKNSKNQDLAKAFVDWALSPPAQEIGKTVGSFQNITNRDAVGPEQAVDMSKITLIDYDIAEAGSQRQRIIDKWNSDVSK
ncbi:iron ABC transporter substrate-binding protein [Paenibacillus sp. FSL H8-0548]|uniref:ABC transporter substrate-binding protein n=1 Tax=Paenibacillus sp. FSL H8-0548 TaxID=1920422 RepID=UPI00096E28EA|nr:ABC transporter substrate-binding protein [Paenibacillus sp. FSL H8-0548]OMF28060.1 iron ABC transporter substrate-binding protein [Paenibacillus sp. FSL H8-0548]